MHSVCLSGFVCIVSSQIVSLNHALSCMPFFSYGIVASHHGCSCLTSWLHYGWLKRVDVFLEGTYLLTLSVHFCLKVDHKVSTGVSAVFSWTVVCKLFQVC